MAEHEHHHHHDHDEDCCCEACSGIGISSHEGALIGTLTGHIAAESVDAAKELLSSEMTELAVRINASGGVIGHIKAIVSEEGRGYQISVTEEDAVVRTLLPSAYRADCTAIVFAVEEDVLRGFMKDTVGSLIIPDEDDECCEDDCDCGHEHGHHGHHEHHHHHHHHHEHDHEHQHE